MVQGKVFCPHTNQVAHFGCRAHGIALHGRLGAVRGQACQGDVWRVDVERVGQRVKAVAQQDRAIAACGVGGIDRRNQLCSGAHLHSLGTGSGCAEEAQEQQPTFKNSHD